MPRRPVPGHPTTGRAIATAADIPAQTLNALWPDPHREPSLKVMSAIVDALGGELSDYLVLVEDDTAAAR